MTTHTAIYKIGMGYDIHRFVSGRKLFLGGVEIPYPQGLDGYSDADVLLHAICDAMLGAAGLGDIGEHFPNSDARYKNIQSVKLLQHVLELVKREGYRVGNLDTVIQAEEPNLKDYKPKMRAAIAKILSIEEKSVNIKATTQERLGPIGRKEGIAAFANVLLIKESH